MWFEVCVGIGLVLHISSVVLLSLSLSIDNGFVD